MKLTKTLRQELVAFLFGFSAGRIAETLAIQWSLLFFGMATILWLFDFLNKKKTKRYRTKAMFVVGVVFGLLIWLIPTINSRVFFIERYADEWGGAPGSQARVRTTPLRSQFIEGKDYRFTPAIENQFPDSRLDGIIVFLEIPNNLEVKNTVGNETYWRISRDRTYFAQIFSGISSGYYGGVYESLWLRFPAPGRYPIHYHASGEIKRGGTNGFKLDGWIIFEMMK